MSATDELRAAATRLRALARDATPGPWTRDYTYIVGQPPGGRPNGEVWGGCSPSVPHLFGHEQNIANATFVATMDPLVALALADLLDVATKDWDDEIAAQFGEHNLRWYPALTVARAINSGAS
jgi:hypothetical protein